MPAKSFQLNHFSLGMKSVMMEISQRKVKAVNNAKILLEESCMMDDLLSMMMLLRYKP